jgi:hypothetical protein
VSVFEVVKLGTRENTMALSLLTGVGREMMYR